MSVNKLPASNHQVLEKFLLDFDTACTEAIKEIKPAIEWLTKINDVIRKDPIPHRIWFKKSHQPVMTTDVLDASLEHYPRIIATFRTGEAILKQHKIFLIFNREITKEITKLKPLLKSVEYGSAKWIDLKGDILQIKATLSAMGKKMQLSSEKVQEEARLFFEQMGCYHAELNLRFGLHQLNGLVLSSADDDLPKKETVFKLGRTGSERFYVSNSLSTAKFPHLYDALDTKDMISIFDDPLNPAKEERKQPEALPLSIQALNETRPRIRELFLTNIRIVSDKIKQAAKELPPLPY